MSADGLKGPRVPSLRLWLGSPGTVLLLALLIRALLGVALGASRPVYDDQSHYFALRDALWRTGRFVDPSTGLPTAFRDPAYVFFLAGLRWAFGTNLVIVWVAQALVSAGCGALLVDASRRLGGPRVAAITGTLFLLHGSFASYTFLGYSETLVTFALCAIVWCVCADATKAADRRALPMSAVAAAGVTLGRAALSIPVGALLLTIVASRSARRSAAWVGLVALIVSLALWSARDQRAVGVFAPNTNGALNVYFGNNASSPLVHSYRAMNDSIVWEPLRRLGEGERSRRSLRLAAQYVWAHPAPALARAALRVPDALEFDRTLLGVAKEGQFPTRARLVIMLVAALVALATTLPMVMVLGMVFSPGPNSVARAGRNAFAALVLIQVVSIAHSRFTLPLWVALLPGAALFGERLLLGERAARTALWGSALVLAAVFVREILLR